MWLVLLILALVLLLGGYGGYRAGPDYHPHAAWLILVVLIIVLILLIVGAIPHRPYSY